MQTLETLTTKLKIYFLSEKAVTVEFGRQIDENLLARVSKLNGLLNNAPFPGFEAAVSAYATLSVFYDPVQVIRSALPGKGCFEKVSNYLENLKGIEDNQITAESHPVIIPVCYGGEFGPDLERLSAIHQLAADEVVALHSNAIYKVYMIGFVPGFAYLGGMNPLLATPRKAVPRRSVPAGSVGIAGQQTGIYPVVTPGGWQLIGQTPIKMFDPARKQPSLLKAGDNVVFKPISPREFYDPTND